MTGVADPGSTPPPPPGVPPGSRRADAQRNRRRIVAAAVAVFATSGLEATMPAVAAAAGVGKASVYRNFPTKADLVDAVVASEGAAVTEAVTALARALPPRDELPLAVSTLFSALGQNSLLADALATRSRGEVPDALLGALWTLVEHGKAAGSVRGDLTTTDLEVVLCGAVRQLRAMDVRDVATWERAATLVVRALTA
ncbi:TetR family transcriptional regulator [Modestobacter sp. L9-4]|nr:TetR family transcriptional regulator [Modestobacter sp. L9-4]